MSATAGPDWSDRVNYVAGGEAPSAGYDHLAGRTMANLPAFLHDGRAADAVYRAINAPATGQLLIRGVHNGVSGSTGDVSFDQPQNRRANSRLSHAPPRRPV